MKIISADEVHAAVNYPALVDTLQEAFAKDFKQPPRSIWLLDEAEDNFDTLASLSAWNDEVIAVKAFTYYPSNTPPQSP
jgi:1-pyrroline-2-carboxylate reductase [NAD(P)H]